MKLSLKIIILILLLISGISGGAGSVLGDVNDIKVNDDNSTYDQFKPRIAVSKNGNFAVVWTDKRAGQNDIYFQLFDSSGTALGSNKKLSSSADNIPQFEPAIDANYSSQYVSVWRDFRNGSYPLNPDIYFSRIDTAQTPENIDVTTSISDINLETPDIAMFPDGASIVVWADYRNGNWDIYGQRLNAFGGMIGSHFMINSSAATVQQHSPRVAAFTDGGFIVVWYDNRLGHDDIFYRRFDAAATAIGLDRKVNDDVGTTRQAFPVVTADGNKQFNIAWVDWRNGTYPANPDIYMRRYDSAGTALATSKKANTIDGGTAQRDAAIATDRMGNTCVVWADSSSGEWDARAQLFDYTGLKSGNSFTIHDATDGKQLQPDVAVDGYKFYFAWADARDGNYDIYAAIKKYNDPTLTADPNMLTFSMEAGGDFPDSQAVALTNGGIGEINWRARSTVDWLTISPDSGQTPNGFYAKIVSNSLSAGTYVGEIILVDVDNGDSTEVVQVILNMSSDTVQFFTGNAMSGGIGMIPLVVDLGVGAKGGYIPFSYEPLSATLDSIIVDEDLLPDFVNYYTNIGTSGLGELGFMIDESVIADSLIPAGQYTLASLFFTAADTNAHNYIDSTRSDSSGIYILNSSMQKVVPTVVAGDLVIGSPTAVADDDWHLLPETINLEQNYPNPFNSRTVISFELPRMTYVTVDVYNLLGQRVTTLAEELLPAGRHQLIWDGRLGNGADAPSGIYFYSLTAGDFNDIRKMVLLK